MTPLITDEMVEAGVAEIRKVKHTCFDRWTDHDAIRAVLEAGATSALAAKEAELGDLKSLAMEAARALAEFSISVSTGEIATYKAIDVVLERVMQTGEGRASLTGRLVAAAGGSNAS